MTGVPYKKENEEKKKNKSYKIFYIFLFARVPFPGSLFKTVGLLLEVLLLASTAQFCNWYQRWDR
jgi:hypothetical protein